ncbi:MAG: hypothetical protein EOO89_32970, partial [Pedobacter sp.]
MKTLIGKDYVQATYDKFVVIQTHVSDFIRHQYKKPDYPLTELKLHFLSDLDYYLKVVKDQNQNTINKVIERLKKVIKIAVGNGWLSADPFILYQKKKYVKEVIFLTKLELKKLESHKFVQQRLEAVRDCFIFSCYTGLAYNEAALLTDEHLQLAEDGYTWIEMIRQKTQRPIAVPVLSQAMQVLKKYDYPNKKGLLLPLISNQKMNSYLKEIGPIVGINKILTHHIARKTYASTVLMNNDIPVEMPSTSTPPPRPPKPGEDNVSGGAPRNYALDGPPLPPIPGEIPRRTQYAPSTSGFGPNPQYRPNPVAQNASYAGQTPLPALP